MESAPQCVTGPVTNSLLQMSSDLGMKHGLAPDAFQPFTQQWSLGSSSGRPGHPTWLGFCQQIVWCSQPLEVGQAR